eukprot:scaffold168019_cov25-Tisochrysis_lutea.AAC.2
MQSTVASAGASSKMLNAAVAAPILAEDRVEMTSAWCSWLTSDADARLLNAGAATVLISDPFAWLS